MNAVYYYSLRFTLRETRTRSLKLHDGGGDVYSRGPEAFTGILVLFMTLIIFGLHAFNLAAGKTILNEKTRLKITPNTN